MNRCYCKPDENYTIPVCDIINQIWIDDHENNDEYNIPSWREFLEDADEKIEYAGPIIFGEDWECYGDSSDRLALEKHILTDYYTRQINCDSVARWVMFVRNRMHDIMPKYVGLYNGQMKLLAEDPLSPYHIEESKKLNANKSSDTANHSTNNMNSETNNESNSSNVSKNEGNDDTISKDVTKFSNTPQALAEAVISGDDIPLNYLSTMQTNENDSKNNYNSISESGDTSKSKNTSTDSNEYESLETGNENRIEEYIKNIKGNILKYNNGQLIKDYQNAILNIESMISEELKDLFFLMY